MKGFNLRFFIVRVWDKKLKAYFHVKVSAKDTARAQAVAKKAIVKHRKLFHLEPQGYFAIKELEIKGIENIFPSHIFTDTKEAK